MHENNLPIRIYYEDTDAGGIVYYANYMRFAERGRTEFLRDLGYENGDLMEKEGIAFVVRKIEADYLAPAKLDDMISVRTVVDSVKKTSFVMKQTVFRQNNALFEMYVTLVTVSLDTLKPVRMPENLEQKIRE